MEKSLDSAIEKIKRKEQNKEVKLKAKRELQSVKAALDRSFRDVEAQIKKFHQDKAELIKKTDTLMTHVTIYKIRRDVLISQLAYSTSQLSELKAKSEQTTLALQELRSNYCKAVYGAADECDVWALLTKPSAEPLSRAPVKNPSETKANEQMLLNERRLTDAKERHRRALAECERLRSEPDTGEEFIR